MKFSVWILETTSPGFYVANDVSLLVTVCLCMCVCVCLLGWGSIIAVFVKHFEVP